MLQGACQHKAIDGSRPDTVVNAPRAAAGRLSRLSQAGTLASHRGTWQGATMDNSNTSPPAAGGCLLAASIVVGAFVGVVYNQISAGIVIGVAVGAVIAVAIWLRDRTRRRDL
jgi:hypothetical protein